MAPWTQVVGCWRCAARQEPAAGAGGGSTEAPGAGAGGDLAGRHAARCRAASLPRLAPSCGVTPAGKMSPRPSPSRRRGRRRGALREGRGRVVAPAAMGTTARPIRGRRIGHGTGRDRRPVGLPTCCRRRLLRRLDGGAGRDERRLHRRVRRQGDLLGAAALVVPARLRHDRASVLDGGLPAWWARATPSTRSPPRRRSAAAAASAALRPGGGRARWRPTWRPRGAGRRCARAPRFEGRAEPPPLRPHPGRAACRSRVLTEEGR